MLNKKNPLQLAIIGAGAAGFFAANNLAQSCPDLQISIFEAGSNFLSKVLISGGGRCNVTNGSFDLSKLAEVYPRGSKELRAAFSRFAAEDTVSWFAERGVELKTEADGRIFPVSDSSQTIADTLSSVLQQQNVKLYTKTAVSKIEPVDAVFKLELSDSREVSADFVLIATGSSKTGHALAVSLGHSLSECAPSLFSFKIEDPRLKDFAGISFPEVNLLLETGTNKTFRQSGAVLITHWGLSGPAVLKLSAFAARELAASKYQAKLSVNWIAESDHNQCVSRLRELRKNLGRRAVGANPQFSLSQRFWEGLLAFSGIPAKLNFHELSNQQINRLCSVILHSELKIIGKGEFKEEFVTCGGVNLKEIDFKSFESKIMPNLFLAGEILDVDGITGGYNFQAAWSGGWLAAQEIGKRVHSDSRRA